LHSPKFSERMTISRYLASHGVPQRTIDELLPHIPAKMQDLPSDDFWDAATIIDSDTEPSPSTSAGNSDTSGERRSVSFPLAVL
jgi:hypothetical protein